MPRPLEGEDVTTLMLHGIPSRMSLADLLAIFKQLGFDSDCFDFLYMPRRLSTTNTVLKHYRTHANFGYAFINLASPQLVVAFAHALHHHPLGRQAPCGKVFCGVARVQGLVANLQKTEEAHPCGDPRNRLVRYGPAWFWFHDQCLEPAAIL
jgi:hypothetical protein